MICKKIVKLSMVLGVMTLGISQSLLASDAPEITIKVELREWMITLDKAEVNSGLVTFEVTNHGVENHEFVVIKSELEHGVLPTVEGRVDEALAGELIGEIEDFAPQGIFKASFRLAPGRYVLICNIVEKEEDGELESHYHQGMHRAFKVLP